MSIIPQGPQQEARNSPKQPSKQQDFEPVPPNQPRIPYRKPSGKTKTVREVVGRSGLARYARMQEVHQKNLMGSSIQTQNDYLRDFIPRRDRYVQEVLAQAGPEDWARKCKTCEVRQGSWRCRDCFGGGVYCMECFRVKHQLLPFHKVEHWSGTHFEPAWLCQAGVTVHLGHGGFECPGFPDGQKHQESKQQEASVTSADTDSESEDPESESDDPDPDVDDNDDDSDWEDDDYVEPRGSGTSALPHVKGAGVTLVVDTSGIHKIRITPCSCPNAAPLDIQLLRMGLFPTSFERVQTVITFGALEDQRLDNLECKTPMLRYWNKLRRKTTEHAWLSLPVGGFISMFCMTRLMRFGQNRYREFSRVSRMWRNIQNIIRFGFGHSPDKTIGPGSLALFCAACPQPGINLPDRWEDDPEQ